MAVNPDVTAAVAALERSAATLKGAPSKQRLTDVGVALKPVMTRTVSLGGDRAFSGWTRTKPIDLEVAFKVHTDGIGLTMHRQGRSAGPWRVAEDGRKAGMSKARRGRRPRRVGSTGGKRQWSKAESAVQSKAPNLLTELTVRDVERAFGGR